MARTIKRSAITFGGYLYQNLIGIELLCDWLDDPRLYEWVKFESDDDEVPKGLDDIVAQRPDGSLILLQVKFTVDQFNADNSLSWDWLLRHKPNGRSLIQKWAEAFFAVGTTNVAEVALVTNRLPDREFHSCLDESTRRVDLARIPRTILKRLGGQLRGEERLAEFLHTFEFRHSHQSDIALERTLRDRFVPRHTTHHGWVILFREAIDWAVRKNFPPPDGRIVADLLHGLLDSHRPTPLQQSFLIPTGYSPPDEDFGQALINRLTNQDNKVVVLWGSPGQGKSTYLSYLSSEFERRSVPYIRHHYFLDLADTSDRFSLPQVANSLMAQMEANHVEYVQGLGDNPRNLRDWIEACARGYASDGRRFIVLIDGLDHVWRENEHNKRPLDSLFQCLLPVPDNVTLLIGTQKVSDEQLPTYFAKFVISSDWVELPRMSLAAIKKWLLGQFSARRFELPDVAKLGQDPITEVAEAFERLSGGHPLLLTYGFEALAREERVLTANLVDTFPIRPDGDIKMYYKTLWQRLPFEAKDALHLIADAGFVWPPLGLETCLGIKVGELGREIGHLFYLTDAGQVPFHGSLLAFIQDESDHVERVGQLLPTVVEWLDSKAPNFHRWGWLWLYKARAGSPNDLLTSPCQKWVIDSLSNAYPDNQIVEVLSAAERTAFERRNFARAVRLRWLKIRVLNGTEFQLDDYGRLYRCALQLSDDDYPLRTLSASFHTASVGELHLLGAQYLAVGRVADAAECQEHMRQRINDRLKAHAYDNNSLEDASKQYLELAAATGEFKPDRLLQSVRGFRTLAPTLFRFFLRELSKRMDLHLLMDFASLAMPRVMRQDLELATIRLAGMCQARVHDWPDFNRFRKHPISACWAQLYAPTMYKHVAFATYDSSLDVKAPTELAKESTEQYLHGLFFFSVARSLELGGAPLVGDEPEFNNRPWLSTAAKHILMLANAVGRVLSRGEIPAFALPYRLLDTVSAPEGYESFADYVPFRRAVLSIAQDVFLLSALRSGLTEIPEVEWYRARDSRHFVFSEWLERYVAAGQRLVTADAIETELQRMLKEITQKISPFNERTQKYLELCELALHQGLDTYAADAQRHALSCVIGYGWRKDGTLFHVLDAITAIASVDEAYAKDSIVRISPIVSRIGDMTEDDGVRESDLAGLLLKLMPRTYVNYYAYWLTASEWYSAERVFSELLANESLSQPLIPFVTCAVWDSYAIGEIKRRALAGDAAALTIVEENARRFGHPVEDLGKERFRDTPHKDEEHGIDVRKYDPDALKALLDELREQKAFVAERSAVRDWFNHWRTQNRGIDLLRTIKTFLDDEVVPTGVSELLDDAFELSLALEGKRKAYPWLVAAQIYRHGWESYYSESDSLDRFAVFAHHYANQWEQFISDTAKSAYHTASEQLVIPHHRLVRFLVAVGQVAVAKTVVEEMLCSVIEDFSDQPLATPPWLSGA